MTAELLARNVAAHWVQAGLVVAAVLAALRLLRVTDARLRLAALHVTLAAIVLLPIVQDWRQVEPAVDAAIVTVESSAAAASVPNGVQPPYFGVDAGLAALGVMLSGILLRLIWLAGGLIRLVAFRRTAREIAAPAVAREVEAVLGVTPRYFEHSAQTGPASFGVLRAAVVLPSAFASLDREAQRAVICHELLHVRRRDAAAALIEEALAALLWFHPWIWVVRSRIRIEREHVVDQLVVEHIGSRDRYVRCLVELSGHDLVPHLSAGMLGARALRARIDAILKEESMSMRHMIAAAAALIAVVRGAASAGSWMMPLEAQALQQPNASSGSQLRRQISTPYAEFPQEAIDRRIAGTVIVDVVVNASGDVTTGSVVSGPQELRASAFKAALGLKFDRGTGTTPMRVAVEYRLTADSWGVRVTSSAPGATAPAIQQPPPAGTPLSGLRVGGDVRPPKKIADVPPTYPDEAQKARVQGVVILEARIDEAGRVSDTRLLRSIPLLDQAAIEAVRQWRYEPTLLNGVPVPVVLTVTTNFTLRDLMELQVILPDGNTRALRVAAGALADVAVAGGPRFQIKASRQQVSISRGSTSTPFTAVSPSSVVTVSVYGEDGRTHLGDVQVHVNGPAVALPTVPAVGLRLLAIG